MDNGVFDLTGFQRDLLCIAAEDERRSGQEIKDEIERAYGKEITHGRLYPNLDFLSEEGLIEKGAVNRRKNYYQATDDGLAALEARRAWEEARVDLEIEPVDAPSLSSQ